MSKYLSDASLRALYHANFESLMRYGLIFWGSSPGTGNIFVIQKRILRTMFRMTFRQSCRGTFRKNKILTIYALYLYECLLFLFKNRNKFTVHNTNFAYDTRTMDINYPVHRLTLSEKNPSYMCIRVYNKLPSELRNVHELKVYKKKVWSLLIELEPYNLNEYFEAKL